MIRLPRPSLTGKILIIYYMVGIIGLSIPALRGTFTSLTPLSLLMSLVVLLLYQRSWKFSYVFTFLIIALLGFLVEVAGVLSGQVFGSYAYGATLGIKLFDTPLMIGINWLMLIYCVHSFFERMRWPAWLKILTAAMLMVVYDFIMEPVAISLDMWSWGGGSIPLQNYVAWFAVSIILLGIMHLARVRTSNPLAVWLFSVQAGFFLALNFLL